MRNRQEAFRTKNLVSGWTLTHFPSIIALGGFPVGNIPNILVMLGLFPAKTQCGTAKTGMRCESRVFYFENRTDRIALVIAKQSFRFRFKFHEKDMPRALAAAAQANSTVSGSFNNKSKGSYTNTYVVSSQSTHTKPSKEEKGGRKQYARYSGQGQRAQ